MEHNKSFFLSTSRRKKVFRSKERRQKGGWIYNDMAERREHKNLALKINCYLKRMIKSRCETYSDKCTKKRTVHLNFIFNLREDKSTTFELNEKLYFWDFCWRKVFVEQQSSKVLAIERVSAKFNSHDKFSPFSYRNLLNDCDTM